MDCEYCKKQFASTSSLNNHKKKALYCLKIQKEQGVNIEKELNKNIISEYNCNLCNKKFKSKINLKHHLENLCTNNSLQINDIIKKLKEEVKSRDILIDQINASNNALKEMNNFLKGMNSVLKTDHDCVHDIAKQPKNINNNKILNILSPMDFTNKEIIKNKIEDSYKLDYIFSGQKGIAKFAFDHLLKDEEGNLKYICTDPSRQIFKYKDETGEVRKDVEAKKLTNFLVEGGIKHKASNIMNDWWTEETGITNTDKFELLVDKAESLRVIDSDNNEFKKELATMTTV